MMETLLCSNNPILVRSLYAILRDEGYTVDTADHPSLAVQMAFKKNYSALIIDSEPFGLSVEDAIKIIKTIQPAIVVIFIGYDNLGTDVLSIEAPIDLEQFKQAARSIGRLQLTLNPSERGIYGTKRNRS
jgi:DNA-binding NtrC family response regulator